MINGYRKNFFVARIFIIFILLNYLTIFFIYKTEEKTLVTFSYKEYSNLKLDTNYSKERIIKNSFETLMNTGNSSYLLNNINITSNIGAFNGYNLFILDIRNTNGTFINKSLIITNMEGEIIINKLITNTTKGLGGLAAEFINSTTIMIQIPFSVMLWNIYNNKNVTFGFYGHHEVEYNHLNNTIFTLKSVFEDINGSTYGFDKIVEYNFTNHEIWSLDARTFQSHTQWCPFRDMEGGYPDITHANTVYFDNEDDKIYFNSRNTNTFYKIDHKTKKVLWGLGEYGNFTLFDKYGRIRNNLFYHAHAVERIDENTFILYDNDYHNQTNPLNRRTRMIEIKINETTMTANESWSWAAPPTYFCQAGGDADRLPNGNRLGTFGGRTHPPYENMGARLVEVNENGQIVWEMNFPNTEEYRFNVPRTERFNFAPILDSPVDLYGITANYLFTENITVSWNTWYNFRPKRDMYGNYTLYLDEEPIMNGSHKFDRYWRPSSLTFNISDLHLGNHNLTLVISDEAGNTARDTLNVSIGLFKLEREGPLAIEYGQVDSVINWNGYSAIPLTINITTNDSIFKTINWINSTITLDLNSLNPGNHNIELGVYDNIQLLYIDNFWVTVYPKSPPTIEISLPDYYIFWNDTLNLKWNICDTSPLKWEIYINSTLSITDAWTNSNFLLNWDIPILHEGKYEIKLIIYDLLEQNASNSLWITILPPKIPIIAEIPSFSEFNWGTENISLNWEVHGGKIWKLWRNNTLFRSGEFNTNQIIIQIRNWQQDLWRPGSYNLTLQITNIAGLQVINCLWIQIKIDFGDSYANDIVKDLSLWYQNEQNAIGAPDGKFTLIFSDYANGYLTLDMGFEEEIVDREGMDFTVIAQGGEYTVKVANNLSEIFILLGKGTYNQSFDLATVGLASVRYVQVEYGLGDNIRLDAIVAINFNQPIGDTTNPTISGPANFEVWENQTTITLKWEVFDDIPWNYSIYIDGELVISGPWNGSNITFSFKYNGTGEINVTLIIFDAFGNNAIDSVVIKIRSTEIESSSYSFHPTGSKSNVSSYSLLATIVGIILFSVLRKRFKFNISKY